jgi:putative methionine-R-sulfoxide reductase with GAF domain
MDDRPACYRRLLEAARARGLTARDLLDAEAAERQMTTLCDLIWDELGQHRPVSWVGFYWMAGDEMTLGPRRDKPACSPIGLHGACGQAALAGKTLVVRDVAELGEGYIACDPRDRSEIVVPVRGAGGEVRAVLDVDSHAVAAFGEPDRVGMEQLLAECLEGRI